MRAGRRTIELSHPEKAMFPEDGITKADLARYYLDVAWLSSFERHTDLGQSYSRR